MSGRAPEPAVVPLERSGAPGLPARFAGSALRPALVVPRLFLGAIADIRTIAESTRALPELAEQLGAIQARVASLDNEVARMRRAVESIGGDVVGVRESTEPLAERLDGVHASIAPLARLARLGRRSTSRPYPPG